MKIFNWMQSKLGSKQETKTSNFKTLDDHSKQIHSLSPKDEFSDWPQGLLAIGTFGLKNSTADFKEYETFNNIDESIQKEMEFFAESTSGEEKEKKEDDESEYFDYSLEENFKIKTPHQSNSFKEKNIRKKSISFLFKKMFFSRSGFSSTPSFKDSFSGTKLDKSRMEKILRAVLHAKIYPQTPKSSSITTNKKIYLQNNDNVSISESDEDTDNENEGSKWVKTDSEYIVLEI